MVGQMTNSRQKKTRAGAVRALSAFRRDEDGAIIVFSLFVFFIMIVVGGIAVDMMRYESERVRLQGTADRAALAATMLRGNPNNPDAPSVEEIVRSYFEAEGLGDYISGENSIVVSESVETGRTVTIRPTASMRTSFMRLSGVNELQMNLLSEATEGLGEIRFELVMVVDVSGSMGAMTASGQTRIQELRNAANVFVETMFEEIPAEFVAITIVPYDSWVVPPAGFTNHFTNVTNPDSNAPCIDFSVWDTVANSINTPVTRHNCNTAGWRTVRPMINTLEAAQDVINDLRAANTTSIDLGVRFGGLFFDPTMRPAIDQMIDNGQISQDFRGLPYDWNEPLVYRAMILMTDGDNCCFGQATSRSPNRDQQDQQTVQACQALRARGVQVYGVAFEAPPVGTALMEGCASSPGHFFNSSGAELSAAFRSIATHIQTSALRLTR